MPGVLFECAIRAMLIAIATATVLWVMRVKTAPARHAVWTGVVVLMLLLPLWTAWGPRVSWRVLPPARHSIESVAPVEIPNIARLGVAPSPVPTYASRAAWNWWDFLLAVYGSGVLVLLARLAVGTAKARVLAGRAVERDGLLTSASCASPVTIGWLGPVVILPEAWREWPAGQLDAVLTHEREHARRRDPLVQWLALLNRAIFWFHPLAWWLENRLSALAEEACDNAVLERGHDAREYSGYLLDIARAVLRKGARVDVLGMAMPGSFLSQRIEKIFEGRPAPRMSRTRLACASVICAFASIIFAAGTLAQSRPAVKKVFEVASVKPAIPLGPLGMRSDASGGPGTDDPGLYSCKNCSLYWLFFDAYRVEMYEYAGPDWLQQVRFDVSAKVPAGATKQDFQMMMQNLLAERFKLVLHREKREMQVYELSVGKNGPKFKEGIPKPEPKEDGPGAKMARDGDGYPILSPSMTLAIAYDHARLRSDNQSMEWFIGMVKQYLGGPVTDATGLKGTYDFVLSWTFEGRNVTRAPAADGTPAAASDPTGPDLITAIQTQLGLKVERKKGLADVLVIDSVEKAPTEN